MNSDYPQYLAHLFTSNIAPGPLETRSIEDEIEGLTNAIEQLQQRLQKLERQRQCYRTLLSPVRQVPPEVLGEIFACVLAALELRKEPLAVRNWPSLDVPLISLCLVCRAWRDTAFSTPRLWTHPEIRSATSRLWLEKASRWFDRCKGISTRTLTINVDSIYPNSGHDCAKEGCKFTNPDLARLLTEGPSFEKLVLCCTSTLCFRALMALMDSIKTEKPRPWDSIKSLDLYFMDIWGETDPSDSLFRHIPPVTSFLLNLPDRESLAEDPSELDEALLHLGSLEHVLTNLTTFTLLCNWDGTMILEVLQMCHNLEDLTLDFQDWVLPYRDAPSLVQASQDGLLLPKLRILRLCHAHADVVDIIQFFKTPTLAELDISFADTEDASNFIHMRQAQRNFPTIIRSLVNRSRCEKSLRKFRLDSVNVMSDQDQLIEVLTNFPYLTHLILDNVYFDPCVLHESWHGEPTIIPRLEVLEVLHIIPHFPLNELGRFVNGRGKLGNPNGALKKFVATFRKYIPPDFDFGVRQSRYYTRQGLYIPSTTETSLGFA